LDRLEILTLQCNYIGMMARDNNDMVCWAGTPVAGEIQKSVLAEHGFSAVVRTTVGDRTRTMLFDFGFEGVIHRSRLLGYSGRLTFGLLENRH
jgi:7,8-dihydropterin-6-yl-methyl-4-(beta-D-ribofuranosyl)aminobenzene 5'-phosphate synthase